MKTKLSGRFWLALVLFGLMGQIAWVVENMYLNVFIYKMFNATADNISLMVAASAVSATLTTVFIGALSDRVGKRKVFICGGYILWGISIFGFALLKVYLIGSLFPAAASSSTIKAEGRTRWKITLFSRSNERMSECFFASLPPNWRNL
jgi:MFS family permease